MCEWKRKWETKCVSVCVCIVFLWWGELRGVLRWKEGNHQTYQLTLFPSKILSKILPSTTSIWWRMNTWSQKKQEKQSQFFLIWMHYSSHIFHIFIILLRASENSVTSQLLWVADLKTESKLKWMRKSALFKTRQNNLLWWETSNYCMFLSRRPLRIRVGGCKPSRSRRKNT